MVERAISQAPATAELCNRLYDKINDIDNSISNIAKLDPTTDALLTFSLVMGWCRDARNLILEIKSQL